MSKEFFDEKELESVGEELYKSHCSKNVKKPKSNRPDTTEITRERQTTESANKKK